MDKIYICDLTSFNSDISANRNFSSEVGRLLLKYAFNELGIDITKHKISYNEYKKPYIDTIDYHFNISHDESLVCLIISDVEVGIDIECINHNRDVESLAKKVFDQESYTEFSELKSLDEKVHYFYKYWVRYEAYVKKIGSAINLHYKKTFPKYDVLKLNDLNNKEYYLSTSNSSYEIIRININELFS